MNKWYQQRLLLFFFYYVVLLCTMTIKAFWHSDSESSTRLSDCAEVAEANQAVIHIITFMAYLVLGNVPNTFVACESKIFVWKNSNADVLNVSINWNRLNNSCDTVVASQHAGSFLCLGPFVSCWHSSSPCIPVVLQLLPIVQSMHVCLSVWSCDLSRVSPCCRPMTAGIDPGFRRKWVYEMGGLMNEYYLFLCIWENDAFYVLSTFF